MGGVSVHICRFDGKSSSSGIRAAALSFSGRAAIAASRSLILVVMSRCQSLYTNMFGVSLVVSSCWDIACKVNAGTCAVSFFVCCILLSVAQPRLGLLAIDQGL